MRFLFVFFGIVSVAFSVPLAVFAQADNSEVGFEYQAETTETDSQLDLDSYERFDEIVAPEDLPPNEYMRGVITEIIDEGVREPYAGYREQYQLLRIRITSGVDQDEVVTVEYSGIETIDTIQHFSTGDRLVVVRIPSIDGGFNYFVGDTYRLNVLLVIFGFFVLCVLWLTRLKGVGSLLGLVFSIAVLAAYIVPRIAAGSNPIITTIIGSGIIILVSLYLAHGFNHRTTLSLVSTSLTLVVSLGLAWVFVHAANLMGLGSEEAFYLQSNQFSSINLQGLLLAGILIGTLGVLDDITTAQTAVVGELRYANPELTKKELYKRALVVGKEHIASLVNTLVLAYAGASLPLFLLFSQTTVHIPLWFTLNTEFVAEEVIRTLVGSLSLVLAVPISSYIAAHFISQRDAEAAHVHGGHGHHH